MRPQFFIDLNGEDITRTLEQFCPGVQWTDSVDDAVDELTLTLVDGGRMSLPQKNAEITLYAGYAETGMERVGTYYFRSPQTTRLTMTLSCPSLPAGNASHANQDYERTTIGAIAQTVAQDASLTPAIDAAIGDIKISHISQRDESGIAFLSRLVASYGGTLKFGDGKLAVVRRGAGTSVSGVAMTATISAKEIVGDYDFTESDGFTETAVTSYDYEKAERKIVKAKAKPEVREVVPIGSAPDRKGDGAVADNIDEILKYVK